MTLDLTVSQVAAETDLIRRITLVSTAGALPSFTPGAAITVHLPGVGRRRYSLVQTEPSPAAFAQPASYMLGVRREDQGGGGSRAMHGLKPGDILRAEPPQNDFMLTEGSGPVLLLAGGVGVTPLISKAAAMKAVGRPFRFVYAARRRDDFAFLVEIRALAGDSLVLHADEDSGAVLDVPGLLAALPPDMAVHACGPTPMLKAAIGAARTLGWPEGRLRFERFYSLGPAPVAAPAAAPGPPVVVAEPVAVLAPKPVDGAFEVEIASTGQVFVVPPDRSIVDVLVEAGLDPLHDCLRGECGVCQVGVIAGIPDHRDSILSDSERAAGKVMQICISRARSPRLTLDL